MAGDRDTDHRLGTRPVSTVGRAFHAGTRDQHAGCFQPWQLIEQTVQTGHTHIHHQVNADAMELQGQSDLTATLRSLLLR